MILDPTTLLLTLMAILPRRLSRWLLVRSRPSRFVLIMIAVMAAGIAVPSQITQAILILFSLTLLRILVGGLRVQRHRWLRWVVMLAVPLAWTFEAAGLPVRVFFIPLASVDGTAHFWVVDLFNRGYILLVAPLMESLGAGESVDATLGYLAPVVRFLSNQLPALHFLFSLFAAHLIYRALRRVAPELPEAPSLIERRWPLWAAIIPLGALAAHLLWPRALPASMVLHVAVGLYAWRGLVVAHTMMGATRAGRGGVALAVLIMILHPWLWSIPVGLTLLDGVTGITEGWMGREVIGGRVRADRDRLMGACVRYLRPAVLLGLLIIAMSARGLIGYATPQTVVSAPLPVASEGEMATLAMVGIPRFEIDRYEHPGVADALPTTGLSLEAARDVCEEAGKRLCSSVEFFHACAHGGGRAFLLESNEAVRASCHVGQLLGVMAGSMARTGSHPDCRSEGDVYDLTGNAFEWVEDDRGDGFGTLAGSYYGYADDVTMDCGFRVLLHPSQLAHVDLTAVGFRCCR